MNLLPKEAAERLRVHDKTLARWRVTGDGPRYSGGLTVQCATSATTVGRRPHLNRLIFLVSALGLEPRTP
ncbi:MAG: hypothetical protein AAGL98_07445 [Planctomycetota bacterium]